MCHQSLAPFGYTHHHASILELRCFRPKRECPITFIQWFHFFSMGELSSREGRGFTQDSSSEKQAMRYNGRSMGIVWALSCPLKGDHHGQVTLLRLASTSVKWEKEFLSQKTIVKWNKVITYWPLHSQHQVNANYPLLFPFYCFPSEIY